MQFVGFARRSVACPAPGLLQRLGNIEEIPDMQCLIRVKRQCAQDRMHEDGPMFAKAIRFEGGERRKKMRVAGNEQILSHFDKRNSWRGIPWKGVCSDNGPDTVWSLVEFVAGDEQQSVLGGHVGSRQRFQPIFSRGPGDEPGIGTLPQLGLFTVEELQSAVHFMR